MRAAMLALICGATLIGFTGSSLAAEPFPLSSATPTSGATYESRTGIAFEVVAPPHLSSVRVEIATQNIPGQDGTLAEDFTVDSLLLFESDAYPGTYRGTSSGLWSNTPGTYYWEVSGTEYAGPLIRHYVGPVYTIVIEAVKTPTLSVREAKLGVKEIIRAETHRDPHYLRDNCRALKENEVSCSATWAANAPITPLTSLYSGAFALEVRPPERHIFAFVGTRAQYGCVKRHGARRCSHGVRWAGG